MTCEEEIQMQQPGSWSEQHRDARKAIRQTCLHGREILSVDSRASVAAIMIRKAVVCAPNKNIQRLDPVLKLTQTTYGL